MRDLAGDEVLFFIASISGPRIWLLPDGHCYAYPLQDDIDVQKQYSDNRLICTFFILISRASFKWSYRFWLW